jgi:hypothetical protein
LPQAKTGTVIATRIARVLSDGLRALHLRQCNKPLACIIILHLYAQRDGTGPRPFWKGSFAMIEGILSLCITMMFFASFLAAVSVLSVSIVRGFNLARAILVELEGE